MKSLYPKSLLWRIGITLMGAQLIIAIIVGWYSYIQVRQFHYTQTLTELQRVMPIIIARLSDVADTDMGGGIDEAVKNNGDLTGIRITVILPDGLVIGDSETDPATMENHRYGRPEIEAALTEGEGSAIRFSTTLDQTMMYFAQLVETEFDRPVLVRTALPLTRIDEGLRRVTRVGVTVGGCSLLITFIVMFLVSVRFSGQVSRLADGAIRYAHGELDHRVEPPAAAELSALAESLNDMAGQLDDRIKQLQARQNELRAILQSMSNGVIALDHEHRIISVNRVAEHLLGRSAETLHGRLLEEVIREPELHAFVSKALSGEGADSSELRFGEERSMAVQVTGEPLVGADDQQQGLLIILNEVTQLRRLESLRSDFAANVSHELRTPITNIKGYVETLLEVGWGNQEQADRFLNIIRANSDRLSAIVEDVMSLAKFEQPQTVETLERAPVSIKDFLESVAAQFDEAAGYRAILLVVIAEPGLKILLHRQMIEQAVSNLLSNAVRYTTEKTTVTIRGQLVDENLVISVEDEGPGIAPEHLPRLFERFYRVDKGRSRELGGTGLGLAIVKHVALLHGGHAEVESDVGRGSVFRIILPGD